MHPRRRHVSPVGMRRARGSVFVNVPLCVGDIWRCFGGVLLWAGAVVSVVRLFYWLETETPRRRKVRDVYSSAHVFFGGSATKYCFSFGPVHWTLLFRPNTVSQAACGYPPDVHVFSCHKNTKNAHPNWYVSVHPPCHLAADCPPNRWMLRAVNANLFRAADLSFSVEGLPLNQPLSSLPVASASRFSAIDSAFNSSVLGLHTALPLGDLVSANARVRIGGRWMVPASAIFGQTLG